MSQATAWFTDAPCPVAWKIQQQPSDSWLVADDSSRLTSVEVGSWISWSGSRTYHWGRVTHICVSKLTIIASDNGLSPGRRQAIIWNNAVILSIRLLGTNFSEILIEILTFSFKKMYLKISSGKRRPFCLGLNVLMEFVLPFLLCSAEGRYEMTFTCQTGNKALPEPVLIKTSDAVWCH